MKYLKAQKIRIYQKENEENKKASEVIDDLVEKILKLEVY